MKALTFASLVILGASSCKGVTAEAPAQDAAVGSEAGAPTHLALSEIMYHPVLENSETDEHEFVELHNPGASAVSLDGFRLEGSIQFAFTSQTVLAGGAYLVVAKNRQKLIADVPTFALDPAQVLGDYAGTLDNGGGVVALIAPGAKEIERVAYSDHFPWPLGADALGASEEFFDDGDPRLPLQKHQYRGYSLERISYDAPADDVSNWAPSALDGMTPGKANRAPSMPPVIALTQTASPAGGDKPIGPTNTVVVSVTFSPPGPAKPQLETFVEFKGGKTQEFRPTRIPLVAAVAGFQGTLPAQPANTVVRYRILDGDAVISPRPSDPNAWYLYFVNPAVSSGTKAVHLFITPFRWGTLWTNIGDTATGKVGRVPELPPLPPPPDGGVPDGAAPDPVREIALHNGWDGCKPNPDWDKREPAVFVVDGRAFDVRVRYQGSGYGRVRGVTFTKAFAGDPPVGGPVPMQALSWSVVFPRYALPPDGRKHLHLNKMTQACPGGLTTQVVPRLFTEAGIPALQVFGHYRMYVNGGYYHYVMDREHEDEDMLGRVYGKDAVIGDLWKDMGWFEEQGPYGVGDFREINALCGFTAKQRYDTTYERVNHDWRNGADDIRKLIEDLSAARAADAKSGDPTNPVQRQLLTARFDLDEVLTYKAIVNWARAWDEYTQNVFFYKRPDGKFQIFPYDFDYLMTEIFGFPTTQSLYIGELNDPDARVCCGGPGNHAFWNVLFDSLFKTFRKEFNQKVKDLDATILAPANVSKHIDDAVATSTYRQDEARLAPGGTACFDDYLMTAAALKAFSVQRHAFVVSGTGFKN